MSAAAAVVAAQVQAVVNAAASQQRAASPALVDIDTDDEGVEPVVTHPAGSLASTLATIEDSREASAVPATTEVVAVVAVVVTAADDGVKTEEDDEEDELATTPGGVIEPVAEANTTETTTRAKTLSPARVTAELDFAADTTTHTAHTAVIPEQKKIGEGEGVAVPDAVTDGDDDKGEGEAGAQSVEASNGTDVKVEEDVEDAVTLTPGAVASTPEVVTPASSEEVKDPKDDDGPAAEAIIEEPTDAPTGNSATPISSTPTGDSTPAVASSLTAVNGPATTPTSGTEPTSTANGSDTTPNGTETTPAKRKAEITLDRMAKYGRRTVDRQVTEEVESRQAQFDAETKELRIKLDKCKEATAAALAHLETKSLPTGELERRTQEINAFVLETTNKVFEMTNDLEKMIRENGIALVAYHEALDLENKTQREINAAEWAFDDDKWALEERRFKAYKVAGEDAAREFATDE